MTHSIKYSVLKDGDRHLRGKIAEEIFERAKDMLFLGRELTLCKTHDLSYVLMGIPDSEVSKIITQYALGKDPLLLSYNEAEERINEFRKKLEISVREINISELSSTRGICALCFGKGKFLVDGLYLDQASYTFWLCGSCLEKCLQLGYITGDKYNYTVKDKEFDDAMRNFIKAIFYLEKRDAFRVLSRLDETSIEFLYEVYGGEKFNFFHGQWPFDYVAVDNDGKKYLIDVTSVRGEYNPAGFSRREKEIAEQAKKVGFSILVPVVKFLEDWQVVIELSEV